MEHSADTDHPIHELLRRRWSPRAFADRPVEPEKLRSLLEAARWAPSCYNAQPWRFIVATRDKPTEYERLLGCLIEFNQGWARQAPVLMLTVAQMRFEHNGKDNVHAWHDVGLATANLLVQATALGLYAHAMAGFDANQARARFNIPAGYEPVAAIAIGYLGDPATLPEELGKREHAPRQRKPLSEWVFSGKWGQTAPLIQR
jgi:nitroreductase